MTTQKLFRLGLFISLPAMSSPFVACEMLKGKKGEQNERPATLSVRQIGAAMRSPIHLNETRDVVLQVENTGTRAAKAIVARPMNDPFSFKGGSYPGEGGTCGVELEPSSTCSVILSVQAEFVGEYSQVAELGYEDKLVARAMQASVQLSVSARQITTIAAGRSHTCVLYSDSSVSCWGSDQLGQLGDNSELKDFPVPIHLPETRGATSLSAGEDHTCVVGRDARAYCWGSNAFGQLGIHGQGLSAVPVRVPNLEGVVQIVAGERHNCALLADQSIRCWGSNEWGQLGSALPAALSIAAGADHTCAITLEQKVVCWGRNDQGQLGTELVVGIISMTPVPVAELRDITKISAGSNHTCALRAWAFEVLCWGANHQQQVGANSPAEIEGQPLLVEGTQNFVDLDAGGNSACALNADGGLACWGSNTYGQIGNDYSLLTAVRPVVVRTLKSGSKLVTGARHACAAEADGQVYCWGSNESGQLGNGESSGFHNLPVLIDLL